MKILIIKPSSFGDIIHANPTLVALKKLYPDSNISWLVFDTFADLLSLFPDVDDIMVWNRNNGIVEFLRVIMSVQEKRFDLVIDLQGLLRTSLISLLSGARQRIGVPGLKEFSWIFEKEVFPESSSFNAVNRNLETVRFIAGKKVEPKFNIKATPESEKRTEEILEKNGLPISDRIIGIVPHARGLSKRWPKQHYMELIDSMLKLEYDIKILILGNKGDFEPTNNPDIINLCGQTSLPALHGILKKCRLVIGGDTGPVQLAAALNIPTIAIFGGSDVNETAPISRNAVIIRKDYPCSPCRTQPKCKDFPCLREIKPEDVLKEVKKWIK
ncbi:MAG: lipopolysaccharide heptosyltransferase II [Endomicrobiales bacterium]|nr:lipopolysaccharide heptosyltransferase II [Endomicrobiales bacterium]